MITVTERATKKALEIRDSQEDTAALPLRISIQGGGCSGFTYDLTFDDRRDGDISFEFDKLTIITDQMSMMYLDGVTIDYQDGLMGEGFKVDSPNMSSKCGCGKSFSF